MSDEAPGGTILVSFAGLTDIGLAREVNEDTFRITALGDGTTTWGPAEVCARRPLGAGLALGVYDGVGGYKPNTQASAIAARTIHEGLAGARLRGEDDLRAHLARVVRGANVVLKADASLHGAASTATVAALVDACAVIAQVGDSRAYLLRGRKLVQLTRDDRLTPEMIGTASSDLAAIHANVVTKLLGYGADLEPSFSRVLLRRGDVLLLCTDGLSSLVPDPRIRATLLRQRDPGVACRVLRDEALAAGGHDNLTIVVARFDGDGLMPPIRAEKIAE